MSISVILSEQYPIQHSSLDLHPLHKWQLTTICKRFVRQHCKALSPTQLYSSLERQSIHCHPKNNSLVLVSIPSITLALIIFTRAYPTPHTIGQSTSGKRSRKVGTQHVLKLWK